MKAHVVKSPLGIFAFSDDGELLFYEIFKTAEEAADRIEKELPKTFTNALRGYELIEDDFAKSTMRKNLREYALTLASKNSEELNEFLSDFSLLISQKRLKGTIGKDRLVIQASNALDETTKKLNTINVRLSEWYTLHYPELKEKEIAEKVAKYGRRENFPNFKSSTGAELSDDDEKILKEYAETALHLSEQKKKLEKYVKDSMKEVAPNFSSLIDPLLAARILAMAGSLEKLARMTTSTIQLIGAEKALFRHLHNKGKSPKFGLIYNTSYIQNAPDEKKGKTARVLASKLMQAAKIDFYSGRYDEKLKKELEKELQ